MDDHDIHARVTSLVAEEHQLRAHASPTDEDRTRLRQLEEELDQCWDLLRQREARRDAGTSPDTASARPVDEVEHYLQ